MQSEAIQEIIIYRASSLTGRWSVWESDSSHWSSISWKFGLPLPTFDGSCFSSFWSFSLCLFQWYFDSSTSSSPCSCFCLNSMGHKCSTSASSCTSFCWRASSSLRWIVYCSRWYPTSRIWRQGGISWRPRSLTHLTLSLTRFSGPTHLSPFWMTLSRPAQTPSF